MKPCKPVLMLAVVLASSAFAQPHGTVGVGMHYGGYGGWHGGHCDGGYYGGWWPSLSLGFGFGAAYPAYSCYSYPVYSYPVYTYSYNPSPKPAPASSTTVSSAPDATAETAPPEQQVWVPASPGKGEWVPDPEPYSFAPETPQTTAPPQHIAPRQTTVTRSDQGIVVFSNR
jgi:hypothetical protein